MDIIDWSIEQEYDWYSKRDLLLTYSEEEKQENEINRENAKLIFSPKFIPFYPKLLELWLTHIQVLVYWFIDFYLSWNNWRFYFSNKQLWDICKCSERTAQEAIQEIEKIWLIKTNRKMKAGWWQIRFIEIWNHIENNNHFNQQKSTSWTSKKVLGNNNKINNNKIKEEKENIKEKEFEEFWKIYPNKKSKEKAKQIFNKITTPFEKIMLWLKKYIQEIKEKKTELKYIKHPTTRLNQWCWEDQYDIKQNPINSNIPKKSIEEEQAEQEKYFNELLKQNGII